MDIPKSERPKKWHYRYAFLHDNGEPNGQTIDLRDSAYPWAMTLADGTSIMFFNYEEHHNFVKNALKK